MNMLRNVARIEGDEAIANGAGRVGKDVVFDGFKHSWLVTASRSSPNAENGGRYVGIDCARHTRTRCIPEPVAEANARGGVGGRGYSKTRRKHLRQTVPAMASIWMRKTRV